MAVSARSEGDLKGWSLNLAPVDMAWGTFVTAVAATAGYFVTAWLAH